MRHPSPSAFQALDAATRAELRRRYPHRDGRDNAAIHIAAKREAGTSTAPSLHFTRAERRAYDRWTSQNLSAPEFMRLLRAPGGSPKVLRRRLARMRAQEGR